MERPETPSNSEKKAEQFRQGVRTVLLGLFSGLHYSLIQDTGRTDDVRHGSWAIGDKAFYVIAKYADDTSENITELSLTRMETVVEDLRIVRFYFYDVERGIMRVSDENPLTLEEALHLNGKFKELDPTQSPQEAGVAHGVMRANDLFKLDFLNDLDSFPRRVKD